MKTMRKMIEMMTKLARKSSKPQEKPRESQANDFFELFFCAVWRGGKKQKKQEAKKARRTKKQEANKKQEAKKARQSVGKAKRNASEIRFLFFLPVEGFRLPKIFKKRGTPSPAAFYF